MSATRKEDGDGSKSISVQVTEEFADDFDRAVKQAQLNGDVPLDMSRSEGIRRLMRRAIDNPSLMSEADEED